MVETWLPGAERIQGPLHKQGYLGTPRRTLGDIEGEVNHSAEGSWAGLLAEIQNPLRLASWTFSIRQDGHIVQHYPFESITWHCGRKGDLDPDTEITGNIALVGKEFAGRKGEPIVGDQEDAGVYITDFVRDHTFAGSNPPELAVNLFEHNWINPNTSCPSARVQWPGYLNKVAKIELGEDDMTDEEHSTLMNVQKQMLEVLHILKGGTEPSMKGLPTADSVLGRLKELEKQHEAHDHH